MNDKGSNIEQPWDAFDMDIDPSLVQRASSGIERQIREYLGKGTEDI